MLISPEGEWQSRFIRAMTASFGIYSPQILPNKHVDLRSDSLASATIGADIMSEVGIRHGRLCELRDAFVPAEVEAERLTLIPPKGSLGSNLGGRQRSHHNYYYNFQMKFYYSHVGQQEG